MLNKCCGYSVCDHCIVALIIHCLVHCVDVRTTCTSFIATVGDYRPPFQEWGASPNPSIEEMKSIVVVVQRRPEIPKGFMINSVSSACVFKFCVCVCVCVCVCALYALCNCHEDLYV